MKDKDKKKKRVNTIERYTKTERKLVEPRKGLTPPIGMKQDTILKNLSKTNEIKGYKKGGVAKMKKGGMAKSTTSKMMYGGMAKSKMAKGGMAKKKC